MTGLLHELRRKHPGNVKDKIDTACLAQPVVQQGSWREREEKPNYIVNLLIFNQLGQHDSSAFLMDGFQYKNYRSQNLSKKIDFLSLYLLTVQKSPEMTTSTTTTSTYSF